VTGEELFCSSLFYIIYFFNYFFLFLFTSEKVANYFLVVVDFKLEGCKKMPSHTGLVSFMRLFIFV